MSKTGRPSRSRCAPNTIRLESHFGPLGEFGNRLAEPRQRLRMRSVGGAGEAAEAIAACAGGVAARAKPDQGLKASLQYFATG